MATRKANGDGTLRQRPDGRWEFRAVVGTGLDGKPIRKSFYGAKQSEAKRKYKEFLQNKPTTIEKVKTVGEWAGYWLSVYKKGKVAYGTYCNYKLYVEKHIVPALGHLKLDQVKPAHLEQFYTTKQDLSGAARRDMHTALRGIFQTAMDNNMCVSNPAEKANPGKKKGLEIEVFTPDEIKGILAFAPTHKYGHYVELLLYTGLRRGELLALQWSDVDTAAGIIWVHRALAKSEEGIREKKTKTENPRIVGITENLKEVLSRIPKNGLYVLSDSKSHRRTPDHFRRSYDTFFKALAREKKVRFLSAHKCRHTYATYLLRGGASLRDVQALLGHTTSLMTENYTHVNIDDAKRSVLKLDY